MNGRWELQAASLLHSIAQNAIEWGTRQNRPPARSLIVTMRASPISGPDDPGESFPRKTQKT